MIVCENIIKEFGDPPQRVLHGLSFEIPDGQFVSISGRSGSGKSTLLYIISTLDLPTAGRVLIDGRDIAHFSVEELHRFRNEKIGFIFQSFNLIPVLSVFENVEIPLTIRKNLTQEDIDAIAERSPYKFGLKTVGTNIPIISEDEMRESKPDYLLILPWCFISEIVKRESDFFKAGGKFIVPCPNFAVIGE